jgi:hypothetical protein
MSTTTEYQPKRERTALYTLATIIVVLLVVVSLFTFHAAASNRTAEAKADQFIAALQDAGAVTPTRDQVVHVLGDDGGAVCAHPNDSLTRATGLALLANGAAGPGARPVIADSRLLKGELLVLQVYCPDELAEFQTFVNDLKSADVTGG